MYMIYINILLWLHEIHPLLLETQYYWHCHARVYQQPSKRHNLDYFKDHKSRFAEAGSLTLKIRKMSTTVLSLYVSRHAN